ncbi:MAG: mandelate racemase/muconate lactonizing enzyme family protein [Paracoccaceae bacterium]
MKITSITVWQRDLPLSEPYWLSGGRLRFDKLDATFVRLETDAGISGWGEGTPWGETYLPAHGPGIRAGVETLAPMLLGMDPRNLNHVDRALDLALPGHLYVKAPLDIACWDIAGQAAGVPIATLLGGAYPAPVPVASSISTGTPEEMLALINSYRAKGYRVHSAKVGANVEMDIARIRYLEQHRQPDDRIFYDVNRAWTRAEAVTVMNAVADLPVVFEQPSETLDDCLAIRRLTQAPIAIDERMETLGDMTRIIADGLAEQINIKINRVGGLTKAARIRDLAIANGIRIAVMPTGGTVLADTDATHLAQTIPDPFLFAGWSCQDMITVDPAPGRGTRTEAGRMQIPRLPGLGVVPDMAWLGKPCAMYT